MADDCGWDHDETRKRGEPARERSSIRKRGRTPRRTVLAASVAGLAGTALSGRAGAQTENDTVTIVHDLHTHSGIGPLDGPNIARYRTVIDEQLAAREDAVFLTSGDELGSSPVSFFTKGTHNVAFMNELDIAAAGVGNHDFDYGVETAAERFESSEFPWINSALSTPEGDPIPGTERWRTIEVGDLTLGVFNVVVRGFHNITDYPEEYVAGDPVEVSREMVETLEAEGADVIVLASHVAHDTHYEITEAVDGLDAIFGSHSHITFDEAEVHEGTVISEIGYAYAHLGVMTLDSSGELLEWERIDLDESVEPDPAFDARMRVQYADLEEELSREVGETAVELDADGTVTNGRESRLGNLITDAIRETVDAEIALQTAGRIRTDNTYGPGTLTTRDVLQIMPFTDTLMAFEATGEEIREALEGRIDYLPEDPFGARQRQQVGGLNYEWSGHDEPEVGAVYVAGEELDPEGSYTVGTTGYVKNTALGYESLRDNEVLRETDAGLGPAVMEYVESRGRVAPGIENRILRTDAEVGTATERSLVDEEFRVRFEIPDRVESIHEGSFYALTTAGERYDARQATREGESVEVAFDRAGWGAFAPAGDEHPIRVFGGFEPDDAAYGYRDEDDDPRELPVTDAVEGFVMKGLLDAEST
ncbi:bifunctional metallophosphatase/5'-nucleotidase [Halalkalicoccus jeotgali]|uniref:5'-Nucleotidase domain protein n=1 Tax=Halalkalicoccus jeotgali (strain DSM 18796 / CECT 7217 / JCM 14584 / KCTC 4019 / B3) TaxID=795797 RepID=D8J3T2_HALJB|nr:bifunctional UDP-sugar hydrolase/5'-nucleotidase [Halalkalicoccus jeotgali]ADJ13423.1 5'-Nucleotidase domain protein [Halalkalicoccus jeotgali B3]ELY32745.1 5'-Nucleotidase domain-containing protein [Halalkalicoccus jeotgali B3]